MCWYIRCWLLLKLYIVNKGKWCVTELEIFLENEINDLDYNPKLMRKVEK